MIDGNDIQDPQVTDVDAWKDFQALLRNTYGTKVATQFIAWVVGVFAVLSLIGGIVLGVEIVHTMDVINSPAATCQSQGGTNPNC